MLDYKETAESPYFWSHISTNCETLGNNAITLANCLQFNRGSINANGYNFSYYYIQFTKSSSKKKKNPCLTCTIQYGQILPVATMSTK